MNPYTEVYFKMPSSTIIFNESSSPFRQFISSTQDIIQFTVKKIWLSLTAPISTPCKILKLTLGIPFYLALTSICVALVAFAALTHLFLAPWMIKKTSLSIYFHSSIRELPCLFATVLTYFLKISEPSLKILAPSSLAPILFVHGHLHNATAGLFHEAILTEKAKTEGRSMGPFYSINLSTPFQSIEDHTKKVQKIIEEVILKTGQPPILIGHSMGGLVCMSCAKNSPQHHIKAVITLSSPLKGTNMAAIGLGKEVIDMHTHSSLIASLPKEFPAHLNTNCFHMGSLTDIIVPAESALPDYSCNAHYLGEWGHNAFLYTKEVSQEIWKIYKAYSPSLKDV